jgi:aspartyl aminopeptidase
MNINEFNKNLLTYLKQSPTPYHAVATTKALLDQVGFIALSERQEWQLQPGKRYYFTRHDASLLAFVYGQADLSQFGIRMMGAHTDSPCLKVKPRPERVAHSYLQLGVEVYGGALLNPWFDRDLSLAGRVSFRRADGELCHPLVDFRRAIAVIPSLAIHLDREVNEKRAINPQEDMRAILLQVNKDTTDFRPLLKAELLAGGDMTEADELLEFDLSFYDLQEPALIGLRDEFIASARLDNLLSCHLGVEAIKSAPLEQSSLLILNDHEEVGSVSDAGAQGNMLASFLERLRPQVEQRQQMLDASVMFSVDNAHGIHPNYPGKHDDNHGPILNRGPVLKINANQRYATTSDTASLARLMAQEAGVNLQLFVSRADMACGSTIGPMTAAKLGIKTLDIGVPTFAMHSVRELGGYSDAYELYRLLKAFTGRQKLL